MYHTYKYTYKSADNHSCTYCFQQSICAFRYSKTVLIRIIIHYLNTLISEHYYPIILSPSNEYLFPFEICTYFISVRFCTTYSFLYSTIERIPIIRIQYEANSLLTIGTKYEIIKKLESDVSATEIAIHGVGKTTIRDNKKQERDSENYLKCVDSSASDGRKALNILMR